jgi:hypothetical protein
MCRYLQVLQRCEHVMFPSVGSCDFYYSRQYGLEWLNVHCLVNHFLLHVDFRWLHCQCEMYSLEQMVVIACTLNCMHHGH